jgi:tetratricopeptide (TPR) repeat protein
VLCYWLYCAQGSTIQGKLKGIINSYFVPAILMVQIVAACWANVNDVRHPFSNDIPAATYIHAQGLDKLPMLGDGDFAASGIAGILDKEIYYMRPAKWGKFILPDKNWGPFIRFGEQDLLAEVGNMLAEKKSDVVVILNYPLEDYKLLKWEFLQSFDSSIIMEDYYIYKVKYIPETPESLNSGAEMFISRGQVQSAIKLLEKAIQMKPDYGRAYMNLADCYNNGLHNYDKALSYIDSAVKYSPLDDKAVFDKGAILYNAGHKQEGIEQFKRAIGLNPQNVNVYLILGQCYMAQKDYPDAIMYLKMGLKIKPDDTNLENELAQCNAQGK